MKDTNAIEKAIKVKIDKEIEGIVNNFIYDLKHKIKELQNLYSWNQFYQERNLRNNMRVAQAQISQKKREINELKVLSRKK